MKKYLLEIGFSLPWQPWGENTSRMFRTYAPIHLTQGREHIHSFKFVASCTTMIDLTNQCIIKDRSGISYSDTAFKELCFAYRQVPICDIEKIIEDWEKIYYDYDSSK